MPKKLQVINVLSSEYYSDCHIVGSINVSLDKLEEYVKNLELETPIVVYCASYTCMASAHACKKLDALGYKNIWTYKGGMNEWYHMGLPIDGLCKQSYLSELIKKSEEEDRGAVRQINAQDLNKMMKECVKEDPGECCK